MYWPAMISLRNCFVRPVVLSRLALQADKIFKDLLACWQESLPAHRVLGPIPQTSAVLMGAAHPIPPSQQGQPRGQGGPFLREPHLVRARSGRRRAGSPHRGSGGAFPGGKGGGDSRIPAAGGSGTAPEPAERPRRCSLLGFPPLRDPGDRRQVQRLELAFPSSILWQTGVSPRRSKCFTLRKRGRWDEEG